MQIHFNKIKRTPVMLQMDALECGAAVLGSILAYYGKYIPLEKLREECGVNRNGSKANNILKIARKYGMQCKSYKKPVFLVFSTTNFPAIAHWESSHFIIIEGRTKKKIYINDPAYGRYTVSVEDFISSYSEVIIELYPSKNFIKSGTPPISTLSNLCSQLKNAKPVLLFIITLVLLLTISGMAWPALIKILIDNILISKYDSWAKPLTIAVLAILFFQTALIWLQHHYMHKLFLKQTLEGSSRLIWHILNLPYVFFSQRFAPEISQSCHLTDKVSNLILNKIFMAVINLSSSLFYLIVMFYKSKILAYSGLVIISLNILIMKLLSLKKNEAYLRAQQEQCKTNAIITGTIQTIGTIKSHAIENEIFDHWATNHTISFNYDQILKYYTIMISLIPIFFIGLYQIIIIAIGTVQIINSTMTLGDLIAFQLLSIMLIVPIKQLINISCSVQDVSACIEKVNDILSNPVKRECNNISSNKQLEDFKCLNGHLKLQKICFGYDSLEKPLLNDVNFQAAPGDWIAIVGSSGCGKSTLAKIIAGLQLPWTGEILFDGMPKEKFEQSILQQDISYVDQNIFLFEDSFRNNLILWDKTIDNKNLIAACEDALVFDFILSKPGGLDYKISENGSNLSGGERQRLEIARALIKQPTILLLDEATSALAPGTEQKIFHNIKSRGCTCIVITHRINSIYDADKILVMNDGVIIEHGKHEELISLNGYYSKLVDRGKR